MHTSSLADLATDLLGQARSGDAGRAAQTLYGGSDHSLRQTLVALLGGAELSEHESPGEATLQVVTGAVTLHAGDVATPLSGGQLVPIPDSRHRLTAQEDSVVLLTVAKRL